MSTTNSAISHGSGNNLTIPVYNPAIASKRKDRDIMKLLMSDYKVAVSKENPHDFCVEFDGPETSIYEGGKWKVHVILPEAYPYKSPSIGFSNKIFHPNVDEASGSVCLDVINQSWSPMFDLINIFDAFLPQLLIYPNPADPLNPEAAALMLKEPKKYEDKVKDYVGKYAKLHIQQVQSVGLPGDNIILIEESDEMDIEKEFEDDVVSLGTVSELSETSDIDLQE